MFNRDSMILMAHGYNHKLYHYVTTDDGEALEGQGYFNDFHENLDVGDVIKSIAVDNIETPTIVRGAYEHVVATNDGGRVTVTNSMLRV